MVGRIGVVAMVNHWHVTFQYGYSITHAALELIVIV